jgi:hypothetical protein
MPNNAAIVSRVNTPLATTCVHVQPYMSMFVRRGSYWSHLESPIISRIIGALTRVISTQMSINRETQHARDRAKAPDVADPD